MARNRRKLNGEVTFAWVATKLLIFVLLVSFFLGITILQRRNLKLGDDLRNLDHDLKAAVEKNAALEAQMAQYKTPRELESRMTRFGLGMVQPTEVQVRRLPDPVTIQGRTRPVLAKVESFRRAPR